MRYSVLGIFRAHDMNVGNTVFLTNDFFLPAITIAELYRERWTIETFFKWIKQHLHISSRSMEQL